MTETTGITGVWQTGMRSLGKVAIVASGFLIGVVTTPDLTKAAPLIADRAVADHLGDAIADPGLFVETGGFKRFRHGGSRRFNSFRGHRFGGFRGSRFGKSRGFGFKTFRGHRFGKPRFFFKKRFGRFR